MKRDLRCLVLTVVFSLGLLFVHPGSTMAVEEIKIGMILPLTGGAAFQGAQLKAGAEIAAEEINAEGGIKSMGGAKIKLIFGDSRSTSDSGVAETERLITLEKVSILAGSFQSSVTFPGTQIAEKYKVPWLVIVSVKDEITERGFKYTFRECGKTWYDTKEFVDALDNFSKETGKKPKTFGLVYEGTDWGRATSQNAKKDFAKAGYKLVVEEFYSPGAIDLSSQILKIKAGKPDMLIGCLFTPEHIVFQKQHMEQKLYLPFGFWSVGGGSEDPNMYKVVPQKSVEYMFVQEDWDITSVKKFWYPALNKKVREKVGHDIMSYLIMSYDVIYLAKDALERAASADRDKIRDALAATDITEEKCTHTERKIDGKKFCPPLARGIQRIKFDETGQNTFSHGMITQVQKGERIPFFPPGMRAAGHTLAWPIPPWEKR